MVSLATAPVVVLKKSWTGARQPFVQAYPEHKVYAHLEIDKLGRINFVIKLNDIKKKNTLYLHVAKAHLYEMLMYHLTLKPIYPYYSAKDPNKNHIWTYNSALKDTDIHQYDNVDEMTFGEVKSYYAKACQHMSHYVNECSETGMERAERQMDRLLNRQAKMDLLYESERALNKFKI